MKLFFYIMYPLFFFAMGCGIYVAFRDAEGLVDNNYYENSQRYFHAKANEERLGIEVSKPDSLKKGYNIIRIKATTHGKPLQNGDLFLFIGNLSTTGYDSTITMRQLSPGIYQATPTIPFKGVWLVKVDLRQQQQFITSKKWFFEVR